MKRMTLFSIVLLIIFSAGFSHAVGLYVDVDIKPQSCPNPFNYLNKGLMSVAILGSADFDVTEVDPASIQFEGVAPLRWSDEDVTGNGGSNCSCNEFGPDGYLDLSLKFKTQEIAVAIGSFNKGDVITLQLTGELLDGTPIEGDDCVVIVGPLN